MTRPRPTLSGRRSHDSSEANPGHETQSRLTRGQPRAGNAFPTRLRPVSGQKRISDSPEGVSRATLRELPASANHFDPRTCVRTFTCPAEGAKVNKWTTRLQSNLPLPPTTMHMARIRDTIRPLRPLFQPPKAWLHATSDPGLVLGRNPKRCGYIYARVWILGIGLYSNNSNSGKGQLS
jgi:hypothetical protein